MRIGSRLTKEQKALENNKSLFFRMFAIVFPHNLFVLNTRAVFLVIKAKSQEKKRAG